MRSGRAACSAIHNIKNNSAIGTGWAAVLALAVTCLAGAAQAQAQDAGGGQAATPAAAPAAAPAAKIAVELNKLEGQQASGKDKTTKSEVDLSPVMNRIDEFSSEIGSKFEALEKKTDAVSKRVETIENTRPAGNGEGDPDPVQKSDDDDNLWAGIIS